MRGFTSTAGYSTCQLVLVDGRQGSCLCGNCNRGVMVRKARHNEMETERRDARESPWFLVGALTEPAEVAVFAASMQTLDD